MTALTLLKYEGLGNDFLVLIDREREVQYNAQLARVLCDRHHGIGADGLLRISNPRRDGDLFMELRNGDGSVAETSGNGMRCAVLAAFHEGVIDSHDVKVETIVGTCNARIESLGTLADASIRVDMGIATIERLAEFDLPTRHAYGVNIGNPHLVLVGESPDGLNIAALGPDLETAVPGGQNVELATVTGDRAQITIDTWERGAGFTLACGSGSCASAAAARLAGLVDPRVQVHNPGGVVTVELNGAESSPEVVLIGEARRIGVIVFDGRDLDSLNGYMRTYA